MAISDAEANRRWEENRNCMVLAIHKLLLEDDNFRDKYFKNLNHFRSLLRQTDADNFLNEYGFDLPKGDFPPQV